jgi:eukaryotic-like serine/threonine-protein kinase
MMPSDQRLVSIRDSFVGQVLRGSGGVTYHVRECIGEGGQGWVYKANWDEPGGLVVIVKVLRPDAVHGEAQRRFQREADTLRMLSQQARPNPHIVRFFDHSVVEMPMAIGGERISLPFTVLEYVNGPTLEQVLAQTPGRGLAVERVRRLTRQVSLALDAVHQQKIVHRDLKPSNILLANDAGTEVAKVTDFGLVKLADINLHRTATLAGASLGYAPPEQYEQGNKRVSPRTDVFALASIVFEMLTNKAAFPYREGENPLLIVKRILSDPRPSVTKNKATLPPELAAHPEILEQLDQRFARATSPDPEARFETVKEFFASIEPLLRLDGSLRAPQQGPPDSGVSPFIATEPAFRNSSRNPQAPSGSSVRVVHPVGGPPPPLSATPTPLSSGAPAPSGFVPRTAPMMAKISAPPPNAAPYPSSQPLGSTPQPANLRPSERLRALEGPASNPAAWTWSVVTRPMVSGTVRAAAFSPTGEVVLAAGPNGVARWERGAWSGVALAGAIDVRAFRTVQWGREKDALMAGEGGLVLRVPLTGAAEILHVPDRELTFLGMHVDEAGTITLVGERPARNTSQPRGAPGSTIGAIAQLTHDRLTLVADAPSASRLRAATRTMAGTVVACGDWGTLVRLEMGVAAHVGTICGGHLHSIVAIADGGAVTVGVGGHALYVNARLEAQLEAVQTTRDLYALTVGDDGAAWTGSAQARLLRRTQSGWLRMTGDVGITPNVVAVWASGRLVRAVCDDGAMLEGRLG